MENYRNEKLEQYKNHLRGKSCAVLGIGVSNIPLINFLLECGAVVTARDKKDLAALSENPALDIVNLKEKGVCFVTGEGYLSDLSEQIVFKTPGLRSDVAEIVEARSRGAVITSEMEAFLSICPCRIIAVTGSDGKTTTTTLVAKILEKAGHTVHLGGNIGKPLLYETPCMRPSDFAVLELSSFQLHSIGFFENNPLPVPLGRFPDVAIVTNVSPNHLDWHTSYEEYADSKKAIFKNLACGGKLVTNAANEITEKFAKEAEEDGKEVCFFSAKVKTDGYFADDEAIYKNGEKLLLRADIKLPGVHNAENYMAAMAATEDFVTLDDVKAVASSFGGVEHRLEYTATIDGADYYNSSIDSSPTRTIAAVSSFSDAFRKKLVLIMGGYDKNIPYDPVGEPVCRMARAVFLCGATADKIETAIREAKNFDNTTEIFKFSDFKETVVAARKYAKRGDKVILTPASASFDLFKNFDERGKYFKSIVHELGNDN
ncbi:MAG: UDP-N-acetylmuramoyl-L-alanine--D-glutamate ligase [Ruminococcaceae bacterium]|nr:UDP-N-acetylmuramoyl-L-alanine--D-glutamate ligase [Oscillospiraceae bacterium]